MKLIHILPLWQLMIGTLSLIKKLKLSLLNYVVVNLFIIYRET
jgi:hypothetical protein